LMPWQVSYLENLYGWQRSDDSRRYRTVFKSTAKKQGKSWTDSGEAGYQAFGLGDRGAHVVVVANDWKQAGIIFEGFARMVRSSPELAKHLEVIDSRKTIVWPEMDAKLEAISSDVPTKEGWNLSGVRYDELHAVDSRAMWDTLRYSGAAWPEPITVVSTTAGFYSDDSVCWELYKYACGVRDGAIEDDSFFPVIYEAPEAMAFDDPAAWRLANPSLGVTVTEAEMASACREAKNSPSLRATFERYRLNRWQQVASSWIDMPTWHENRGHDVHEASLVGRRCFGGLDLASVSDLTAWVLLFPCLTDPEAFDVLARLWVPEAQLTESRNANLYRQWVRSGHLTTTPGNVCDYAYVRAQILKDAQQFQIASFAVDRLFQAAQLSTELAEEGLPVVAMGQGFMSMAAPTVLFERKLLERRLHHGGNPALAWQAANVIVKRDPAGNLKIDKSRVQEKVDAIVAIVMALDQFNRYGSGPQPERSVYEDRGIITTGV